MTLEEPNGLGPKVLTDVLGPQAVPNGPYPKGPETILGPGT